MIIKVLEQIDKTKKIKSDDGQIYDEIVSTKLISKKMEISSIEEYCELVNQNTLKPYKKRCLLKTYDGQWLMVNHSFKELHEMKSSNNRIIVKGFYGNYTSRSSKNNNRNK